MTAADRLTILEQVRRYSYAWDGRDSKGYAALFDEDAEFATFNRSSAEPTLRLVGRDAILEWAREVHGSHAVDVQRRHHMSSTVFDELTPDRARTRSMLLAIRIAPGEQPFLSATAVYHDEWRREPEGWLLERRHAHFDRLADRVATSQAESTAAQGRP